jgi:voltage-gated potassium channel
MGKRRRLKPIYVEPQLPRWWDRLVMLLTIAAVVLLVVQISVEGHKRIVLVLTEIDVALCGFFIVDFGVRFHRARGYRWRFFKRNWVDLLGCIPIVGPLRAARLIRLVRLVRLTRLVALSRRLMRYSELPLVSETLTNLTSFSVLVWLLAGGMFFGFERGTNPNVKSIEDSLWWSLTTLSTVGYGDLYPVTQGGRLVAAATMVFGVGVLGTLAATIATVLMEIKQRGQRGQRRFLMKNHLLVLNWNEKSVVAIDDFRHDPRYLDTIICIVAPLPETPLQHPVRFVSGEPSNSKVLDRACVAGAKAAIVFAANPNDARSDHETALILYALKRMNPKIRVSAELVSPENREHLWNAGCESVIDVKSVSSALLVRSVQDVGVSELVEELLSNKHGSEIYRVPIVPATEGTVFQEYVLTMLKKQRTVVALIRGGSTIMHPSLSTSLQEGDEAFVICEDPPT